MRYRSLRARGTECAARAAARVGTAVNTADAGAGVATVSVAACLLIVWRKSTHTRSCTHGAVDLRCLQGAGELLLFLEL